MMFLTGVIAEAWDCKVTLMFAVDVAGGAGQIGDEA
jgi:hypothetical protein